MFNSKENIIDSYCGGLEIQPTSNIVSPRALVTYTYILQRLRITTRIFKLLAKWIIKNITSYVAIVRNYTL